MPATQARRCLQGRRLGPASLRLLPKRNGKASYMHELSGPSVRPKSPYCNAYFGVKSLLFMKTGLHWCMHQASLWLWEAGLRPIANLGSNSTVVFPAQHGWRHNLAGRRKLRLFFRPVNAMLHNAHQV